MRAGNGISWVMASVLAIALVGCCDDKRPLGVQESGAGGPAIVPLGTAATFGVLAGSTVSNTGATAVGGDLGVSPGTAVTGFPPGTVSGTIHAGDSAAAQGQSDLTVAYNNAAGRSTDVVSEPPRDSRRLHNLRGWGHGKTEQVLARGT
jgi:Ice-binding-like